MKQRGYLMIGMAVALAILSITCLGLWKALSSVQSDRARIQGEYTAFVTGVKDAGEKAEAAKAKALKLQKEAHDVTLKNLSDRHYALGVKFARLRDAGTNQGASSGNLPPVPDATRPVDDKARDQRLLDVLQHAENQTIQLMGLQDWILLNMQRDK
jgi:hypothetical protein